VDAVICAHINEVFLEDLVRLVNEFSPVPLVLDHSAYLNASGLPESSRLNSVCGLAQHKNIYAKLTFCVTGSEQAYPFTDTHGVIRRVISAYTPERCIGGGDFPCEPWLKKASYQEHLQMFTEELGLSAIEKTAILSETPLELWFSS
jgi:predicted TIM-barrel fold metal-dependent hydrolase